jgi:hypothetical protein
MNISTSEIRFMAQGWCFVLAIAMTFDRYLQTGQNRDSFSRII